MKRLVAALGAVILAAAILQTGVVPVLASIRAQLDVSTAEVSWVVTANLLAAAAATPLIGRLADVFNKKTVLLGTLSVVLAGSVLGALATSLPILVFARALQGISFALYPLAVSILRAESTEDRLVRRIAVLSAMLGLGGALGLLGTGLLTPDGAGYQRIFWLHAALILTVLLVVAVTVPNRSRGAASHVDWIGAAGLALGLTGMLLAVSRGATWGWTSPRTLAAAVVGVAVLTLWTRWTRRAAVPLVSLQMLQRRPVVIANAASFLTGLGSYLSSLGLTHFVQCPGSQGFGFSASVQEVSLLFLLPGALMGTLSAVVAGRFIERYGARVVVTAGGLAGLLGFVALAWLHSQRWEVMVAGVLTNMYLSLSYGALPAMIIGEVDPGETGVATSLNGTFSKIAGSSAAAVVGALLTPVTGSHPLQGAFTAVFVIGALTAAVVSLLPSLPALQSQLFRRKVMYRNTQVLSMSRSTAG